MTHTRRWQSKTGAIKGRTETVSPVLERARLENVPMGAQTSVPEQGYGSIINAETEATAATEKTSDASGGRAAVGLGEKAGYGWVLAGLVKLSWFCCYLSVGCVFYGHEEGRDWRTSVYFTAISITTVGYGDMVAITTIGKMLTAVYVLTGYAIIAVPTGIVTSELLRNRLGDPSSEACPGCGVSGHLPDAKFCRKCGDKIE